MIVKFVIVFSNHNSGCPPEDNVVNQTDECNCVDCEGELCCNQKEAAKYIVRLLTDLLDQIREQLTEGDQIPPNLFQNNCNGQAPANLHQKKLEVAVDVAMIDGRNPNLRSNVEALNALIKCYNDTVDTNSEQDCPDILASDELSMVVTKAESMISTLRAFDCEEVTCDNSPFGCCPDLTTRKEDAEGTNCGVMPHPVECTPPSHYLAKNRVVVSPLLKSSTVSTVRKCNCGPSEGADNMVSELRSFVEKAMSEHDC